MTHSNEQLLAQVAAVPQFLNTPDAKERLVVFVPGRGNVEVTASMDPAELSEIGASLHENGKLSQSALVQNLLKTRVGANVEESSLSMKSRFEQVRDGSKR